MIPQSSKFKDSKTVKINNQNSLRNLTYCLDVNERCFIFNGKQDLYIFIDANNENKHIT